ncbi:hypothetical protein B0H14DRAFT_3135200 [Mycena olivaceomarginata]|nr:hypothetical protein B0H14DRAFT_3135200 [Mycena olivaceomarginata]
MAQPPISPPVPSKSILVFCDGTGMDGILGSLNATYSGDSGRGVERKPGYECTTSIAVPEIPQIVLYQPGVGSQAGFEPKDKVIDKALSGGIGEQYNQALGQFVASKIREVYVFIAQNYVAGDLICIFGYSRGAYTARKVAGIIDRVGILSGAELYKFSEKLLDPKYKITHGEVKVTCVGVWDTVGSVKAVRGKALVPLPDQYGIKDKALPACVEHAYHAVSLQENRSNFLPTLWEEAPGRDLEQVWFLGDHGDVGGGHQNVDLSDISLIWMAEKISEFVDLDKDILKHYIHRSRGVVGWGKSQPNNAFLSLPRLIRMPLFVTQKRETDWKRTDVRVHPSCDKAVPPTRGYEILLPTQIPGLDSRKRADLKPNGFEEELRDSDKWNTVDAKRVIKLDTSEDRAAIGFDKVKRGDGVMGGLVDTGVGLLGELGEGIAAKFK